MLILKFLFLVNLVVGAVVNVVNAFNAFIVRILHAAFLYLDLAFLFLGRLGTTVISCLVITDCVVDSYCCLQQKFI